MTVTLNEEARLALGHLLEHRDMRPATDKETHRQWEECRSYAIEVVNAMLRANPELEAAVREERAA